MRIVLSVLVISALSLMSASVCAAQTEEEREVGVVPTIIGTWVNPVGTVKVRTSQCGSYLCGRVVWASDKAISIAKDNGTPQLIGTNLLREYRALADGKYEGTVFVPDVGRSFNSVIRPVDKDTMRISGCMIGKLICKSQIWKREP